MAENATNPSFRPRRSCLYMPGSNGRAMQKARTINADVIILDLEDAVAPEAKLAARDAVCEAAKARDFGHRELVIRINALDSLWGKDDLTAVVASAPDAILVPKVTSAVDIRAIDTAMTTAGAGDAMDLWVMIEMPLAILNIAQIAAAATDTRLATFVIGTNDLGKEMRAITTADRAAFHSALQSSVTAARAFGLVALDGVYNDIANVQGLKDECLQGRIMGYEGKTLIHPAQLDTANDVFAPDTAEIEQARAIIAAFAEPDNAGKGVIKVNGKMTELLHLEEAHRIVMIADSIEALRG